VTAAISATGIGAFPEGDRLLFEPGGLLLVEAARQTLSLLGPLAASSLSTAALLGLALTLPRALLWSAVAAETPDRFATLLGHAATRIPSLLALTGLGFLAQVLAYSLGLSAAGLMRSSLSGPERGDLFAFAVLALAGALVLALGVLRDVASAAVACGVPTARAAVRIGFDAVRRAPGSVFVGWLGPAALGLTLVVIAAAGAGILDVARAGGFRVFAVALLHQSVLLALSFCRATWFGAAVRCVRPQLDATSAARR
jgi:hypothetical protein